MSATEWVSSFYTTLLGVAEAFAGDELFGVAFSPDAFAGVDFSGVYLIEAALFDAALVDAVGLGGAVCVDFATGEVDF